MSLLSLPVLVVRKTARAVSRSCSTQHRTLAAVPLLVVTSIISLANARTVYAAPATLHMPVTAIYANVRMVKFMLRNDSNMLLKLKVGDNEMTLLPGKSIDVKLAPGQQIIAEETTATNKAGTVLTTAIPGMDGATVSVR